MVSFLAFTTFILGLIIGSFLNCLIFRLEKGESFLGGRSYCPYCHHILAWNDLIPLLSFLFLKGKCRYCGKKISLQYPLVELFTSFLFLSFFLSSTENGPIPKLEELFFYWVMTCFLIVVFVFDLKHYLIPDKVIYPAIFIALIYNFKFLISHQFSIFKISLLSGLGAFTFFLLIVLLSKEKWMGWGDVKLAFLMGLILGWPKILFALFFSFFLGAIIGIGLIMSGKKSLKSEIPFGPFLVTGTFLALFFEERIIDFYFNLFLLK